MTATRQWLPTSWGFTSYCPWPRELPEGLDPTRARLLRWMVATGRLAREEEECPCLRDPCECVLDDPGEIAH